jgi:23S rRNA pseudouridine1911/1915/1917 synthase
VRRLEVTEDESDRLDRYLADRLFLSRTQIASLISDGLVYVDGQAVRKSHVVASGQVIQVTIPPAEPTTLDPEVLPLRIVHNDEHLVVVDKAAGMVVHPAPGHAGGTLVNALLHHVGQLSTIGGDRRPGIVHRLDKDTSGLMVVAKTDEAHRALAAMISRHDMQRGYVAASWGHLDADEQTIERQIGRDPRDRKRMAVVADGRDAITHIKRVESWVAADLLAVRLETGRTHQVRVHLRSIGHPVVSDPIYAPGWEKGFVGEGGRWAAELASRAERLFLHAAHLGFTHPLTGEELSFASELPEPLASTVAWARETSGAPSEPA